MQSYALATRNAILDTIAAQVDAGATAGQIIVYSGTMPTDVDTALAGNTVLATFTCADPAFVRTDGTLTLDADPDLSATGAAAGEATFARVTDSAGNVVAQGTVTDTVDGTGHFLIDSTTIEVGQTLALTAGTITLTNG